MSTPDYISEKYITVNDGLLHLGFTPTQIKVMLEPERTRYTNWVAEANNKVEADTFPFSDNTPLVKGTKEFTFCKSAALNWLIYKKRDLAGSKNAISAKNDYDRDIKAVKELIAKTPSKKMFPIGTKTTDSTAEIIIPYSQTQGFPPDLLY